ncbi:MAG: M61 family metallopeptidase [Armatimonadetes bacterium]|nr:M61 family metallopeptidase [Armatimonadota bacterium]
MRTILLLWLVVMMSTNPAASQTLPIRHTLRFPSPQTHYAEVESVFPAEGRSALLLSMPVWTPGSYLVREFSRNVEDFRAEGSAGAALGVEKVRKNQWRVETGGYPEVVVRYRLYCRELSVRTNWVDDRFALLNGAPTFFRILEDVSRPHQVRLELPPAWHSSFTALEPHPGGEPHHYRATDYDELVDSPVLAGNPAVHRFEVAGVPHLLVNQGGEGLWDSRKAARDVQKIVETERLLWGHLPYPRYLFFNLVTEGGGGLEHQNSTVLMTSRWTQRNPKEYRKWLGLVAHEFFHTWNAKRLRPHNLDPFDYENEVYTPSLWVVEGITSYYDDLLVRRAGLLDDDQYLEQLSQSIERVQTSPGRKVQALTQASFDAWIKLYRPDENSANTSVSYYSKGAVVAFLLDCEMRRRSGGKTNLDDVLRLAYQRYSADTGYRDQEFRQLIVGLAGPDMVPWLERYLDTTAELDYGPALNYYGLRFEPPEEPDEDEPEPGWLGLSTREEKGRLVVTEVKRETPAHQVGFQVDDEIVGLDGYRVLAAEWEDRLKRYPPGTAVKVVLARRGELRDLSLTLGQKPRETWKLEPDPGASQEQKGRLGDWLHRQQIAITSRKKL